MISRELKDFRLILDMGKRLSLLVTLKMNHRLVISISFLFTTERHYFLNQSVLYLETESGTQRKIRIVNFKDLRRGSRSPHNAQFGHFTLLFCRGRQRNVPRIITYLHSHRSLNL